MRRVFLAAAVGALAGGAAGQTCIPEFAVHDLLQGFPFAFSINGGDMDSDGDVDILIPGFDVDLILMLNDGSDDPHFNSLLLSNCSASGDYMVSVADIDGDGDADILSSSWGFFVWYENLGGDPVEFCTREVTDLRDTTGCGAADFDGDGDTDLVAVHWPSGDMVVWYENDGAQPPGFTAHPISPAGEDALEALRIADLEGDGDADFMTVGNRSGALALHQNDGGTPPTFARYDVVESGAYRADFADLDGDGDADVAAASSRGVLWFENLGDPEPDFVEHILDSGLAGPVRVGDMDRDGRSDVAVTSFTTGALRVFLNRGGSPPSFEACDAGSHTDGLRYIDLADLDGDYDLDVIAREWNTAIWFENNLCLADFTGDGNVDTRDFLAFLNTWNARESRADINDDGSIDTLDVLAFLNLWVKGCA